MEIDESNFIPSMNEQQINRNTFTDDGRLLQAEFAIKNVSKAGTIAGLVCTDGVILLGINPFKATTSEKIYQISEKVFLAVSGIFGDALRLIKFSRLECAKIKEIIGTYPKVSVLCNSISKEKQKYTQMVGARPFGVSFLFSGCEDNRYVLYSTDPSGTINRWKACCFGMDSDSINGGLRNDLPDDGMSLETGVVSLLRIIGKAREWSSDSAERMEILLFSENRSRMMGTEEIRAIIESIEEKKLGDSDNK